MPTSENIIETPSGPVVGKITQRLEVLGVHSYLTQTGNLPNAQNQWRETFDIFIPVGTVTIVVSMDRWSLVYGSFDPALLDPMDPASHPQWNSEDHNFGAARVEVAVMSISAPDLKQNPPSQLARLRVSLNLLDNNGDDSWSGLVSYTLTFLGHHVPYAIVAIDAFPHPESKFMLQSHFPKE